MNFPRRSPRSFITENGFLYVIGGENKSTERLKLKENASNLWEIIDVEWPKPISMLIGLQFVPIWRFKENLLNFDKNKVLIFGGLQTKVYELDLQN